MDNFNLKKFLVENKLTSNSKLLKEEDHEDDYDPDYEAELATGGDSKYDGYLSADMGGNPDMYEEEVQEGESVSKYLSLEGAEAIMKELEKDSSKAYMEAKMSKLKEVIETLESKCKSLEESDDAAFISSSKLKEMKNTSKKLRKYEEKMVKEYDKKYADKK